MICITCGEENASTFRFCRICGARLGRACLRCGFENSSESKFCGGCGARIEEVRSEDALGERRQLTVLFCDIAGSTELSRVLDPEDLAELVGEYQKICGDAVRAHEGHIAQYLGDGVVVYFGYPRSHEDEAHRAVRCGLEILEAVEVLRDSSRFPPETSLGVRLGAHTGRVVVGPVGAGDRKDRLALGATPNIAARIQADAEPGTLTVSEATWKIVAGYFTGKRLGASKLKGISEPMELWLVTGLSESHERVEVATMLTPFVGRQQELAVLQEAWRESRSGATRLVQVRGEPGVGKSRLAQLFRDEIQFEAADMLALRATLYTTNTPFHPVIEMLQRRFGQEPTLSAAARLERVEAGLRRLGLHSSEAVALLASLLSLPMDERDQLELSPARQRSQTLELLVDIVAAIAAAGPTLLLVEDLHWMDTSTLDFLDLLVTSAPPVPLLVVVTVRAELSLEWGTDPTFRTIDLARFERSEAEAIVRGVTIGKALPAEILRQIIVRSDGIPLFVEELTHSVLDSGMLSETEAGWETTGPISTDIIPATMDASLTSRIDKLGASRATAQLAATIGREFSFELLRDVSERDETVVRWDVERLLQAGLAWSVDEGKAFAFKHALVRDAAYNSLLRSTRQGYHRRIAVTLRAQFAEHILARPDLIAYHLTNAGEDEEAIAYWEAAGEQALARAAVHEAAEHFTRAIECVGRVPSSPEHHERELELQIRLAPLLMTVYGWGAVEVERACERALALAEELRRYDLKYPPLWGLWSVNFLRGDLGRALEATEPVLQMAQASGAPMLKLTGRHAISFTRYCRGEYELAIAEADAGLAHYDLDQERILAKTFGLSSAVCLRCSRAHSLWMLGRLVDADEEAARLLQLGRDLEHLPSLAATLAFHLYGLGFRYSYEDRLEELLDVTDELLELSREEDFFLWYAIACTYRGLVAQALGEEGARERMLEGLELFQHTGSRLTLVQMNVLCGEALYRMGEDDEAFRRLDVAEAEMTARHEGLLAPDIWRIRGRLLARQGQSSAAEASYRLAAGRARRQSALSLELRAAIDLHELLAAEERAEEGRRELAGVLERFTQGLDQPDLVRAAAIVGATI